MPLGWKKEDAPESPELIEMGKVPELGTLDPFQPEEPRRRFDELVVPPRVRARIEATLNRIRYHDTLYHAWNLKRIDPDRSGIAINLFGPPGTGKTFCAEAIAQYLGKRIIKVNYAEIESKYVGETPKNITAAFRSASEVDAVLFFDESDSILGKRLTQITQSADHGVNVSRAVMLTQLDKYSGVVVFATNLARNYDGAFVRRILAHIEFELPDEACRTQLWRLLMPRELPLDPNVRIDWLVTESAGLSGGDMLNVVVAAASRAVQRQGEDRRLSSLDLQEEIAAVRQAREKIGAEESGRHLAVHREVVAPESLEPEARLRFDAAVMESRGASSGEEAVGT